MGQGDQSAGQSVAKDYPSELCLLSAVPTEVQLVDISGSSPPLCRCFENVLEMFNGLERTTHPPRTTVSCKSCASSPHRDTSFHAVVSCSARIRACLCSYSSSYNPHTHRSSPLRHVAQRRGRRRRGAAQEDHLPFLSRMVRLPARSDGQRLLRRDAHSSNMLYPKEDRLSNTLMFACRTCPFSEPATSACVFRNELSNTVGETAGITQDVGSDPTVSVMPTMGLISCRRLFP